MKRNIGTCVAMEDEIAINEAMLLKYNNTVVRKVENK